MGRIAQILEEIKRGVRGLFLVVSREDIFVVLVIVLVGFGGFGLGRLSKIADEKTPVRIEQSAALYAASSAGGAGSEDSATYAVQSGGYVASVSGTKYHLPWCPGAGVIKEENKIWFATEQDAKNAGYGPAGNCPGI